MKKFLNFILCILAVIGVTGCIPNYSSPAYTPPEKKYYSFDTTKSSYNEKNISASIEAKCNQYTGEVHGFTLSIENNTNNDLSIVWDESYFLSNGTTDGGFMFEGVVYSRRTEPKQDLILLPKTSRQVDIYPNSKVYYLRPTAIAGSVLPGGWGHNNLGTGEYGAYLKLKGKGIDKRIKLLLTVM